MRKRERGLARGRGCRGAVDAAEGEGKEREKGNICSLHPEREKGGVRSRPRGEKTCERDPVYLSKKKREKGERTSVSRSSLEDGGGKKPLPRGETPQSVRDCVKEGKREGNALSCPGINGKKGEYPTRETP